MILFANNQNGKVVKETITTTTVKEIIHHPKEEGYSISKIILIILGACIVISFVVGYFDRKERKYNNKNKFYKNNLNNNNNNNQNWHLDDEHESYNSNYRNNSTYYDSDNNSTNDSRKEVLNEEKDNKKHMKLLKDTERYVENKIAQLVKEKILKLEYKNTLYKINSFHSTKDAIDIAEKNIDILESFNINDNINIKQSILLLKKAIKNDDSYLEQCKNMDLENQKSLDKIKKSNIKSIMNTIKNIQQNITSNEIKVNYGFSIEIISEDEDWDSVVERTNYCINNLENIKLINSLSGKKLIDNYIDSLNAIIDKNYVKPIRFYENDKPKPLESAEITELEKLKKISNYSKIISIYLEILSKLKEIAKLYYHNDAAKLLESFIIILKDNNTKDSFLLINKQVEESATIQNLFKDKDIDQKNENIKDFQQKMLLLKKTIDDQYKLENSQALVPFKN